MMQREESGYDVTPVSEENIHQYECCICQLILKDTQQVVPCGHRFCLVCIKRFHEVSQLSLCPSCRRETGLTFPDAAWEREVMNLKVKCQNHSKSCDWTGELRELQGHQNNTCQYEELTCEYDGCMERMQRRFLNEHQEHVCLYRSVQCSFCGEEILFTNLEEHHNVCQRFPLECLINCGRTDVKREDMDQHIQNECPVTIHECKYKMVGCEVKGNISTMRNHLRENTEQHLQRAVQKVNSVQNTLVNVQRKLDETEKKLDLVQSTLESVQKGYNEHKASANLMFRIMQQKLKCCCPFTFVLTDYQEQLEGAKRNNTKIVSDSFFFLNGYHAEFSIAFEGNGTYVGVYIHLIKGPFDDELEWPMKAKVEFRLKGVNCDDKKRSFVSSISSKEYQHLCFSNPSVVTNARLGWGFQKFILYTDLHKYTKDNSIKFTVNVTEE